jgi:hypothetical protein
MNNLKKLLTATILTGAVSLTANAADTQVETYAHPTLFGSQANVYATTKANYVVGGEVASTAKTAVAGKDNVLINAMAEDVLSVVKEASNSNEFDTKLPVLRSELAVILSESFASGRTTSAKKAYTDVANKYWAESWIQTAQDTGLMIGYPDNSFKPDQRVTKAEVFATIAQIVDVNTTGVKTELNNQEIKYIPLWSVNATKEVVGSNLLSAVPEQKKVIEDEYLSKEQVAYLISALKTYLASGKIAVDANAPQVCKDFANSSIAMKMNSRVSAKHSNVDELFTAKTTKEVTVAGETFAVGSTVTGRVAEVKRPGLNHPGYIKVKFETIKNKTDGKVVNLPEKLANAKVSGETKNPNIVARVCGAPFSASARVVGVAGRSASQIGNISSNRVEEFGDDVSDLFVEPLTGHLGSGLKSAGNGVLAVGKGIYEIGKTTVSGTFGVVNEFTDEVVYLVYPKASNNAALNPNEEIIITY